MRNARVIGHCGSSNGLSPRAGHRFWICAWIDSDLVTTGRVEVAEGPSELDLGSLVLIRRQSDAPSGVDAVVAGLVEDLGATATGSEDSRGRVWIGDRAKRRETGQPQNRH